MPRLTHTILPSLICGLCLLLFAACTENTVSDSIDVDAQVALQSDARTAMSDARTAMSDMGSSTSDALDLNQMRLKFPWTRLCSLTPTPQNRMPSQCPWI